MSSSRIAMRSAKQGEDVSEEATSVLVGDGPGFDCVDQCHLSYTPKRRCGTYATMIPLGHKARAAGLSLRRHATGLLSAIFLGGGQPGLPRG